MAGTDLSDSRPSPFFPASDRYSSDISWLATVTGRLGYARDRWLVYAKGGWAGADVELTLFDRFTPVRASSATWANGWTVGGGAEYALGESLSLAVEYDSPISAPNVGRYAATARGEWGAGRPWSTAMSRCNR